MLLETVLIPTDLVVPNEGQIPGLQRNPRIIKSAKYNGLKNSIKENPDMLHLREVIVFPFQKKYVAIGGNQRQEVCRELDHKEIPCKVLNPQTPIEKLRAIMILDNQSSGEWDYDLLANEWDLEELDHWGMDLPVGWDEEETEQVAKAGQSVVKLEILFDDLDYYNDAKKRLMEIIDLYPGVTIKE